MQIFQLPSCLFKLFICLIIVYLTMLSVTGTLPKMCLQFRIKWLFHHEYYTKDKERNQKLGYGCRSFCYKDTTSLLLAPL
jgi:hypothetical protein